jgi:hypothetical protein
VAENHRFRKTKLALYTDEDRDRMIVGFDNVAAGRRTAAAG